jgi:HEAT repeat protein
MSQLRFLAVIPLALVPMAIVPAPACGDDSALVMVQSLLERDDPAERAIALERIRHGLGGPAAGGARQAGGPAATRAIAGLLGGLGPVAQAELVAALGARGDAAALPAIMELLESSQDASVRRAAVLALGSLGGVEPNRVVPLLERSLAAGDPEKSAARRALVLLRGSEVSATVVRGIGDRGNRFRATLIDVAADRRDRAALPALLAAAVDADAAVRAAAMRALSKLGGPEQVEGMVAGLLASAVGGERNDAEKAIVAVCKQNRGHEQAAERFLALFRSADEQDRRLLLSTLGRIGGPGALAVVDELVASTEPARRAFGLEALTKWPDATVADRLLRLIDQAADPKERDMFLSALIRIAPLPDNTLNDSQKLDLLKKAMALCTRDEDRARILERANAVRTVEVFRFVLPYLDQPALAEPACRSIVELAHHQKLRDAHKEEFVKALDKVIATTNNPENVERAGRYKEGKTWERKKG